MQQQVGVEGAAHAMPVFDVRPWPAGLNPVAGVDLQQQAGTKKGDQDGSLELVARVLDERVNVLPRLAAPALDTVVAGVPK